MTMSGRNHYEDDQVALFTTLYVTSHLSQSGRLTAEINIRNCVRTASYV